MRRPFVPSVPELAHATVSNTVRDSNRSALSCGNHMQVSSILQQYMVQCLVKNVPPASRCIIHTILSSMHVRFLQSCSNMLVDDLPSGGSWHTTSRLTSGVKTVFICSKNMEERLF